jgi:hypothetical protein
MEEKDNPAPVFSGETKDWPTFKDAIQMRADKHGTMLFSYTIEGFLGW